MLGAIIALFIFACIWNDITGPIKRDNFLRKLHSLGNPYGASFDRIKATLGNPDLVETQGNFVAAQWCRYKYRITLGFTNGGCSGVISEQSWQ